MGTGSIHRLSIAARVSAALGAYVLLSACGTLIGWAFDPRWLTSWDGNVSQMPNNAVAVAAAGAALICWSFGKERAAAILGAFTGMVGLATFLYQWSKRIGRKACSPTS